MFSHTGEEKSSYAGRGHLARTMSLPGYGPPSSGEAIFNMPRQTDRQTRDCHGFVIPRPVAPVYPTDLRSYPTPDDVGQQVNNAYHGFVDSGPRIDQPEYYASDCSGLSSHFVAGSCGSYPDRYPRKRYSSCRFSSVSFSSVTNFLRQCFDQYKKNGSVSLH
ncbi:hypothetical protein LSH36_14g12038 [Paralvinella palmiformis]|uniref:Uncharacterized protein n=1 Tax=Paralvinella palmiformis TaxID=53620 RepID=A0AAD9NFY2_9ANNE|nr:hypothetical protein LSH36_14g12038 [Paralvinella palmiformis]